jgi:hypothetical protein
MPRLTTLEDVFFPVDVCRIIAVDDGPSGRGRLPIPEKKALVNRNVGRVLGVVSREYHVVTNRQALDWAYRCCETVFPTTKAAEWDVSATDAPSTGGHCRIDLVHRSAALNFDEVRPGRRPDAFGPFIRVTNSYNGRLALVFDIGFHRKVCKNGWIAPDTIITFKFSHQHSDVGSGIRFDVAHDRLQKLQARLGDYFAAVRECHIPATAFEILLLDVLLLRPPKSLEPDARETVEWDALRHYVRELTDSYAGELGENAYAVLNAITDFASHPPENSHVRRDRHSLQRLAGSWLSAFSQTCRQPGFTFASYLEEVGASTRAGTALRSAGRGSRKSVVQAAMF